MNTIDTIKQFPVYALIKSIDSMAWILFEDDKRSNFIYFDKAFFESNLYHINAGKSESTDRTDDRPIQLAAIANNADTSLPLRV